MMIRHFLSLSKIPYPPARHSFIVDALLSSGVSAQSEDFRLRFANLIYRVTE